MRLTVLGKSPSWQDADGACSGYLLEDGDTAVLLDCGNGASYKVAPLIFQELGAETIVLGNTPNGFNINHLSGSTHPPEEGACSTRSATSTAPTWASTAGSTRPRTTSIPSPSTRSSRSSAKLASRPSSATRCTVRCRDQWKQIGNKARFAGADGERPCAQL